MLARAIAWAGESEAARNEVFNVTNGDVFTWPNVWPAIADALGMEVVVNDPPRERAGDVVEQGWTGLDELIDACDLVSLHVPLTDEGPDATRHLIDRSRRERVLRRNGVWINTCRGEVLSLDDMSAVGGGALALDVWPGEPELPWSLLDRGQYPQIALATPHVAGYSLEGKLRATRAIMEAMGEAFGKPAPRLSSVPPDEASFRSGRSTLAGLAPELERAVELERDEGWLRGLLALPPDRRAAAYRGLRRGYPLRRELGICDPE